MSSQGGIWHDNKEAEHYDPDNPNFSAPAYEWAPYTNFFGGNSDLLNDEAFLAWENVDGGKEEMLT